MNCMNDLFTSDVLRSRILMEIDALYIKDCVGLAFSSPAEATFERFSEDRWCMANVPVTRLPASLVPCS